MTKTRLELAVEAISPHFQSANRVPVQKATVPREEWLELLLAILAATPAPAQPDPLHVANERGEGEPVALKDGQVAALVNELRDIAIKFHGAGQLRERIAQVIRPLFHLPAAPKDPT